MSNIEFTIVIPVKNGANYIQAALQSALSQTYPHFRILVLENMSTDNTLELINNFKSDRIDLVPSTSSLEIEENWGRIIEQPLNEYFTFMGHDDLLYPEFLAEMVKLIVSEPQASLYQVQFEEVGSDGKPTRQPAKIAYHETADGFLKAVMEEREEVCGTGYVVRTQDYRMVGGIPLFPGLLYADVVLWYRLTQLSYKVCSPKTMVGYRVHQQSTHQYVNLLRYYDALRQYHKFLLTLENFSKDPLLVHQYADELLGRSYRNTTAQLAFAPTTNQADALSTAKQRISEDGLFILHDRTAQVYEIIANFPAFLRRAALLPIIILRKLRTSLSNPKS